MRRIWQTMAGWWGASLARRLCADRAGNVIMLSAAMLIPLMALMGSGVDIGRVYVARSRMQQACDAASLAGRWAVASGTSANDVKLEALKYFRFNFDYTAGPLETARFTPAVTVQTTGSRAVTIDAKTTMPLTMMSMFGFKTMDVEAHCSAQQDFVNIDVVLVLDVTGSMLDPPPGGGAASKIEALRKAVTTLYDQLALVEPKLKAANMRLRIGMVSYASTVNVGQLLYGIDPKWIRNPAVYRNGQSVSHTAPDWFKNNWDGCIEERKTVDSIDASTTAIPSGAYDMDVDRIPDPSDPDTQWPAYDAASKGATKYCPLNQVLRLQEWTKADFYAQANALAVQPGATTFHDIGMLWGARLISSGGVFANGPASYHGMPTNRYVIFMTDGQLNANPGVYSAWGVENDDHRTTPAGTNANITHQARTSLLCSAIKNGGASLWVVGFGDPLAAYMKSCATNAGQASNNASADQLITTFQAIGKSIGALRLSQ